MCVESNERGRVATQRGGEVRTARHRRQTTLGTNAVGSRAVAAQAGRATHCESMAQWVAAGGRGGAAGGGGGGGGRRRAIGPLLEPSWGPPGAYRKGSSQDSGGPREGPETAPGAPKRVQGRCITYASTYMRHWGIPEPPLEPPLGLSGPGGLQLKLPESFEAGLLS